MDLTLHALQDDFTLHSTADTTRGDGTVIVAYAYLTDPAGNRLTDPQGNYLVAGYLSTVYPQKLHALQDDFTIHSE